MGQIGAQRVCGRRSDYSFLNATRPLYNATLEKYECKADYEDCGFNKEIDYAHDFVDAVICVPKGEKDKQCPVTKIEFESTKLLVN